MCPDNKQSGSMPCSLQTKTILSIAVIICCHPLSDAKTCSFALYPVTLRGKQDDGSMCVQIECMCTPCPSPCIGFISCIVGSFQSG